MSCSVVMFHVLTTWVSFDCVVHYENESDFVIRDFVVPTNCVLPSHPNSYETFTDSLPSQVAISVQIIKKFTVRKFYVI